MKLLPDEIKLFQTEQADYSALLDATRKPRRGWEGSGIQVVSIGNTGGGSSVVHGQPCGGFLLRCDGRTIIVDPGDNSMSCLKRKGFDPYEITDVLASHAHNDHVGDLSLAISAATNLGLPEASDSWIITVPSLIDYGNMAATKFGFTLPAYSWKANVVSLYYRDVVTLRFDGVEMASRRHVKISDSLTIHATEAHHHGVMVTGFVFDTPMGRIGYTSDSEYFDGLPEYFAGVDLLWMNMNTLGLESLQPDVNSSNHFADSIHTHLGYVGACELIDKVRPKSAIVTHLGSQIQPYRAEVERAFRRRFDPLGISVYSPETYDAFHVDTSLQEVVRKENFKP